MDKKKRLLLTRETLRNLDLRRATGGTMDVAPRSIVDGFSIGALSFTSAPIGQSFTSAPFAQSFTSAPIGQSFTSAP